MRRSNPLLIVFLAFALPLAAARTTPLGGTPPERLFQLIEEHGSAVVIVTVSLPEKWRPEPLLGHEKARTQRAAMRRSKDRVMAKHPGMRVLAGRDFATIPTFAAVVDGPALRRLLEDDDVERISENRVAEVTLAESIPIVGADVAWGEGYSGANQVIAVIDTGVDRTHRFLNGRVVAEACFTSTLTRLGSQETCPTANLEPGQSWGSVSETGTGSARPCSLSADGSVIAVGCDHGTRVAGVAAGRDDGTVGFSGVARDASLIAVNVASVTNCDAQTGCPEDGPQVKQSIYELDVMAAMEHVYSLRNEYDIAAVNLSIRVSPFSGTVCDSSEPAWAARVDQLHAAGIAFVAAAGNDSKPSIGLYRNPGVPACIGNAIAVAATTDQDQIADYSNMAENIDLLAPGGSGGPGSGLGIESSVPGGGFAEEKGTSFASPHVAGAIAILRQRFPAKTVDQLLADLVATGVAVTDNRPDAPAITKPRIDIGEALTGSDGEPPTTPGNFMATAQSATSVSLAWNASTDDVGVDSYVIERRADRLAAWSPIGTTSTLAFTDSTASASTMYAYRVTALDAAQNASVPAADFATTVLFENDPLLEPVDGGTAIAGIHIGRLRQAVDAWRVYALLSPAFTYGAETGAVLASHVNDAVTSLNEARSAIGLGAFQYSGVSAPAAASAIDDDHIQQVRDAMK